MNMKSIKIFWNHVRFCCAACLLAMAVAGRAQTDSCRNHLSAGLELMTQGEVRGGGLPKNFDDKVQQEDHANFLLGRTRINVNYQRPGLEAKVVVQNMAVWGMQNNKAVNLNEGWARLSAPFGGFLQLGRVALSYDDERILGPDDWAMAAYSHDVLRLGYEGHGHKAHAALAYNQNMENMTTGTYYVDGAQPYKSMQMVWYHYDVPTFPLGASLMLMNIGMQAGSKEKDAHTENQQLVGGYLNFHPRRWTAEASYYRQMGKNEYGIKLQAWMVSGKVAYNPTDNYGFNVGYEYLSGDDYVLIIQPGVIGLVKHDVYKGFSPIYGSHHKFYGIMDYFYESARSQGFSPGLQNAYAGGFYKPVPKLTLKGAYHYLASATKLIDLNRTLGHNIDLSASYIFSKDIRLSAGFSYMSGTKTMDALKQNTGSKSVRWGWCTLTISPAIVKTKW